MDWKGAEARGVPGERRRESLAPRDGSSPGPARDGGGGAAAGLRRHASEALQGPRAAGGDAEEGRREPPARAPGPSWQPAAAGRPEEPLAPEHPFRRGGRVQRSPLIDLGGGGGAPGYTTPPRQQVQPRPPFGCNPPPRGGPVVSWNRFIKPQSGFMSRVVRRLEGRSPDGRGARALICAPRG